MLACLTTAWGWLKRDYNWLWIVLLPIGIIVLFGRLFSRVVQIDGVNPTLVDHAEKVTQIRNEEKEAEQALLDQRNEDLAKTRKVKISDIQELLRGQKDRESDHITNPDSLNKAMMEAGQEVLK